MNPSLVSRFWSHVDRTGGEDSCWPWTGAKSRFGYGNFGMPNRKTVLSHRLAFEIANGPLGDLHCLHRCDNPSCCNPKHLFKGTHADNMADRQAKGRTRPGRTGSKHPGERNPNAKLTEKDVSVIRGLFSQKAATANALSAQFMVSKKQIYNVINGKNWKATGSQS